MMFGFVVVVTDIHPASIHSFGQLQLGSIQKMGLINMDCKEVRLDGRVIVGVVTLPDSS